MFKFGGFSRGEKKEISPELEEQAQDTQELEPEVIAEAPIEEDQFLIELGIPLRELWERWKADEPQPVLSLTDERGKTGLHMESGALERERLRIELKLDKQAKSRLQSIRAVEEKGNTSALSAECACLISKDKQVAWVFVFPETGYGDPMSESGIRSALSKAKVTVGIDDAAVQKAAENAFSLIPVAVGIPPVEGEDGKIVEHFPREVVKTVVINEDDTADYRAQNYMQVIAENDVICDIIPPVAGQEGKNLEGMAVKPKAVHAPRVPKGSGTKFSEDGLHLLSDKDGHLEYRQDCFNVLPVLDIAGDIDYSTGNLDFPGDVHIGGDVRECFRVAAQGSIMIDGLVEGAEVEAGSDLIITKGVVGDRRAVLRCGGNLRAKYLESCTVYAGKSVFADCSVNSHIHCDETVDITNGRGSIIGGTVTAGISVKAKLLGARSGRHTGLTLGIRPYALLMEQGIEQPDDIREEAEEQTEEQLPEQLAPADQNGQAEETQPQKIEKPENKEDHTDKKLDLNQCRVECDTAYPITTIRIGGNFWTINDIHEPYKVAYDKKLKELTEQA